MSDTGRAAGPIGGGVQHDAVAYSGRGTFVGAAAELLERGLHAEQACLAIAVGTKVDELRATLGSAARRVSFIDLSVRGRNPARILPAMRSFVEANRSAPVRVVAEPFHTELSSAELVESLLGELMLSRPESRTWKAHISCLYDTASLEQDALDAVATAHPDLAALSDVPATLSSLFSADLPAMPADARSLSVDMTRLGDMRSFVRQGAIASGLGEERSDDLVYAVNEAVTNSICHGEGQARVSLWTQKEATYCEVRDKGRIDNVLVGRVAPGPKQASGRGLWLVNQLCDLVQVRSSRGGTVVRMVVDL